MRSLPPPLLTLLYVLRDAPSSEQRLTDECFLNLGSAHQKSVCVVGKDLKGDFGVKLERRHCRLLCDAAAEAA